MINTTCLFQCCSVLRVRISILHCVRARPLRLETTVEKAVWCRNVHVLWRNAAAEATSPPLQACELKVHTDSLPDFRKTMIDLGNTMRDHTKSIAYLELFR